MILTIKNIHNKGILVIYQLSLFHKSLHHFTDSLPLLSHGQLGFDLRQRRYIIIFLKKINNLYISLIIIILTKLYILILYNRLDFTNQVCVTAMGVCVFRCAASVAHFFNLHRKSFVSCKNKNMLIKNIRRDANDLRFFRRAQKPF